MPQQFCLFAYYDPLPEIRPEIRHYLAELIACGYTVHVALSSHPDVDGVALARSLGLDRLVIWPRHNEGLDFGAWQYLMQRVDLSQADEILLANDSVFGPLYPLAPYVDALRQRKTDVWGMVQSQEVAPHLQSWFIGFSGSAFHKPAVQRIWALPFAEMTKAEIIFHGEVGLGEALRAESCRTAALWAPRGRLLRLVRGNAMHHGWRALVTRRVIPFIKTETLRDNPMSLPDIASWQRVLKGNSFFLEAWIRDYLKRTPSRGTRLPSPWRHRVVQHFYGMHIWRQRTRRHDGAQ